jgi:hypothetical protein
LEVGFGFRSSGDGFGVYYVFRVFLLYSGVVVFWRHNGCFLADFDDVAVGVDFLAALDLDGCITVEMVR